jgi:hypothetical protein
MEVTLIHEATHTSIDARYYSNIKGREALEKGGGCYISTYASDYPDREDLAELMPLYAAAKYFPGRILNEIRDKTLSCSLNRILFLDSKELDTSLNQIE